MSDLPGLDLDEAVYIHELPKGRLAIQLCDPAKEGVDVLSVSSNDTNPHLYVRVGNERARQAVLRLAPEAIVTIIE